MWEKILPSTLHLIIIYTWHLIDHTQFSHLYHIVISSTSMKSHCKNWLGFPFFMLNLNQCFCFSSNVLSLLMSSNGASNEIEQIWYVFVPCYIGHGKQMSFCAACFLSPKQSFFFLDKKGRQCASKWIKMHQKVKI